MKTCDGDAIGEPKTLSVCVRFFLARSTGNKDAVALVVSRSNMCRRVHMAVLFFPWNSTFQSTFKRVSWLHRFGPWVYAILVTIFAVSLGQLMNYASGRRERRQPPQVCHEARNEGFTSSLPVRLARDGPCRRIRVCADGTTSR
jgi:hypothetical protein